ncbi:MAG: hypothetical protein CMJ58_01720 [Planctomycetaceae bacterium]|nr:hypothetical protein [Planctomycetaceae bacterium]
MTLDPNREVYCRREVSLNTPIVAGSQFGISSTLAGGAVLDNLQIRLTVDKPGAILAAVTPEPTATSLLMAACVAAAATACRGFHSQGRANR